MALAAFAAKPFTARADTMAKALEIFAAVTGTAIWLAIIYILLAI